MFSLADKTRQKYKNLLGGRLYRVFGVSLLCRISKCC